MELRPQDHGEKGRGLQGHLPDRPTSSKRQVPEHLRHGSGPRSGAGFYPFGDGKQPWTRPAALTSASTVLSPAGPCTPCSGQGLVTGPCTVAVGQSCSRLGFRHHPEAP